MDKQIFTDHRKRFLSLMKDDSVAVFFSSRPRRMNVDEKYPFSVERNYYYMTGLCFPASVVMLGKFNGVESETLYLNRFEGEGGKDNESLYDRAVRLSGIKDVLKTDRFLDDIAQRYCFYSDFNNMYIVLYAEEINEPASDERAFANMISRQFPSINIINARGIVGRLRSIKSEAEIAEIKCAIRYTKDALELVMNNIRRRKFEYEVRADFEYGLNLNNTMPSFKSIVASGANACILHCDRAADSIGDDELILLDVGALSCWYASDISRTYPHSGKFTQRQREIYEIVLEAERIAIDSFKAGVAESFIENEVKQFFAKALKTIKLIRDADDVKKYYYHSVSHPLGLDVHDMNYLYSCVMENSVHTVEPGLYIKEEGIGIRIEDDIWVNEHGTVNMSQCIIKEINDIENFISC